MSDHVPTIDILGVPVAQLTAEEALDEVEKLFARETPAFVAHTNAHGLNLAYKDQEFGDVLRRADMCLNDGKGIMLAARIHGERFPVDLNGNYFGDLLIRRAAERGWRVFFLGAAPGIAQKAADKLMREVPGLNIVGTHDGYFKSDDVAIAAVKEANAELLFVGMGNPIQERWLDRCLERTGARVGIGVGAFYDFVTETVPRAPQWMNRYGLEWVHRLAQEPKRMWRRYILGNPQFVYRNIKQRRGDKASSSSL
jgi:N-acetylglucosaminyldiphosphoundecaprenol N-acetyl-beta-D-mannosaminyltransferase